MCWTNQRVLQTFATLTWRPDRSLENAGQTCKTRISDVSSGSKVKIPVSDLIFAIASQSNDDSTKLCTSLDRDIKPNQPVAQVSSLFPHCSVPPKPLLEYTFLPPAIADSATSSPDESPKKRVVTPQITFDNESNWSENAVLKHGTFKLERNKFHTRAVFRLQLITVKSYGAHNTACLATEILNVFEYLAMIPPGAYKEEQYEPYIALVVRMKGLLSNYGRLTPN